MSAPRPRRGGYGADPKAPRPPVSGRSAGLVGTALVPDDAEAKPDTKRTGPVWEQVVTDAEGRRRFHGAFTGGFSAGYFNTVGSKEGWAPSTFVSSRAQRANRQQRPEDFMDDEDYSDSMSGGKAVGMKDEFKSFAGVQAEHEAKGRPQQQATMPALAGGSIAGFLPSDLIAPANSPIGVKLLRLMGWREGQGVGPRMERKKRRRGAAKAQPPAPPTTTVAPAPAAAAGPPKRVYGLAISLDDLRAQKDDSEDEDEGDGDDAHDALAHTLPPVDTETVVFDAKANFYGLGYDPYRSAPELRGRGRLQGGATAGLGKLHHEQQQQQQRGGAGGRATIGALLSGSAQGQGGFGLGAFEDAEDSAQLFPDDRRTSTRLPALAPAYPLRPPFPEYDRELRDGDHDLDRSRTAATRIDDDDEEAEEAAGVGGLRGFRASSQRLTPAKWYAPPQVPADYRPFHYFETSLYADEGPGPAMNADKRGEMLGEKPLPAPHMARTEHTGSVFDLVSTADKERLTGLKNRFEKSETETEAMGQAATYHRFANEPAKQMRFRTFLLLQSGQPAPPLPAHYDNITDWEREKEKEEFVKIANDFKKVPDSMASRFQSAGKLDLTGGTDGEAGTTYAPAHEEEDHQAVAASMKMFGKMTRKEEDWFPVSLLCKRFNLRQPHPDRKHAAQVGVAPLLSGMETMFSPTALAMPGLAASSSSSSTSSSAPLLQSIKEEKEQQQEEAEEGLPAELAGEPDRPSVDIFKAIFEPESEDEEESEEDDEEEEEKVSGDGAEKAAAEKPTLAAAPPPAVSAPLPLPAPPALPELGGGHFARDNPYLYVPPKREERGHLPLDRPEPQQQPPAAPVQPPPSAPSTGGGGGEDDRERRRKRKREKEKERESRKREKDKRRKKDKKKEGRRDRSRSRSRKRSRDRSEERKRPRKDDDRHHHRDRRSRRDRD